MGKQANIMDTLRTLTDEEMAERLATFKRTAAWLTGTGTTARPKAPRSEAAPAARC